MLAAQGGLAPHMLRWTVHYWSIYHRGSLLSYSLELRNWLVLMMHPPLRSGVEDKYPRQLMVSWTLGTQTATSYEWHTYHQDWGGEQPWRRRPGTPGSTAVAHTASSEGSWWQTGSTDLNYDMMLYHDQTRKISNQNGPEVELNRAADNVVLHLAFMLDRIFYWTFTVDV